MDNQFKEACDRVLVTLRNARNMATVRQNRRIAGEVLHALALYVQGTGFPCSPDIFEKLSKSIEDKTTLAIVEEFNKVEDDLVNSFHASSMKKKVNVRTVLE